jgi:hypothetical protein
MKLFDLSDDILELVKDELFKLRKKVMSRQLKHEWMKRRPYRKLIDSGGRRLHPGRAFLNKTMDLKDIQLVKFTQKLFICGIELNPFVYVSYNQIPAVEKHGMLLNISRKKNIGRIIELGLKNGWSDFKDQTDNTIIRYLIRREGDRKCY